MELEFTDDVLKIYTFLSVTLGIIVLFVGKRITKVVPLLREFSIPDHGGPDIRYRDYHGTGTGIVCDLASHTLIQSISDRHHHQVAAQGNAALWSCKAPDLFRQASV